PAGGGAGGLPCRGVEGCPPPPPSPPGLGGRGRALGVQGDSPAGGCGGCPPTSSLSPHYWGAGAPAGGVGGCPPSCSFPLFEVDREVTRWYSRRKPPTATCTTTKPTCAPSKRTSNTTA